MQFYKSLYLLFVFFGASFICNAQVENGSFEVWPDSLQQGNIGEDFIDSAIKAIPLEWEDGSGNNNGSLGMYRTTDAADGDYATVIFTWYVYVKSTLAKMDTITERPDFLVGMYKYLIKDDFTDSTDFAVASILVFNSLGDTIGIGQEYLDSVSNYTPFNIQIEYKNNDAGFSYYLSFTSSKGTCTSLAGSCKYLFLDAVKFDFATSTNLSLERDEVNIFPNPSDGIINFSEPFRTCSLYSIQGDLIQNYKDDDNIMLPNNSGIYILRITTKDGITSIHKVKKVN